MTSLPSTPTDTLRLDLAAMDRQRDRKTGDDEVITTTPPSIILSDAEVRAVLGGATRLVRDVEPQPCREWNGRWSFEVGSLCGSHYTEAQTAYALGRAGPFGVVGDVLVAREAWRYEQHAGRLGVRLRVGMRWADAPSDQADKVRKSIVMPDGWSRWKSARTMPACASRLSLRVTAVGVEQVEGTWRWDDTSPARFSTFRARFRVK